MIFVLIKTT